MVRTLIPAEHTARCTPILCTKRSPPNPPRFDRRRAGIPDPPAGGWLGRLRVSETKAVTVRRETAATVDMQEFETATGLRDRETHHPGPRSPQQRRLERAAGRSEEHTSELQSLRHL